MVLIPVVGRAGRIDDFMWRSASPTVTLLLGCPGDDLTGRTLMQVLGAGALRDALFEPCCRAFLGRSPQMSAVNGSGWRGTPTLTRRRRAHGRAHVFVGV
jgi:hypothetical protein